MPVVPIDVVELKERADALITQLSPGTTLAPLEPLTGGTSSITYQSTYTIPGKEPVRVVLKVAPAGIEPVRNRDVLRQARLHKALAGTGVPTPEVFGEHPGGPLEKPPFFIMKFEEGDCVEPNFLPDDQKFTPEETRGRELDAARILGLLHAVDPNAVGLGDEPETGLEAEVAKWTAMFNACDEDLREGTEEIGAALAASIPSGGASVLMHGDYRLGNTLAKDAHVVSVIDWEIWARGDARVDLAWFLMMANPDEALNQKAAPGMPSDEELMATYEAHRGAPAGDMDWFHALVRYKQAAAGAFIRRNARRRGEADSGPASQQALLASARNLLGL